MTRKQSATKRRAWLADLTARDRAARCPICLRALPKDRRFVRVIAGELQSYDSQDCLDESVEREEAKP